MRSGIEERTRVHESIVQCTPCGLVGRRRHGRERDVDHEGVVRRDRGLVDGDEHPVHEGLLVRRA